MVGTASGLWHVAGGHVTVGTCGTLADAVIIRELPVGHSEISKKKKLTFIQFLERERDRACAGEGQRERETQNPKRAPGSELSAQSPTRGSNP